MKKPDTISVHGLDVEYRAWPAHRGHRDKYGCPTKPDEPADFEINTVKFKGVCIDNILDELDAWETINAWVEEAILEAELELDNERADFYYEQLKDQRMGL